MQSSLCVFRKEICLTLELEVTPRFADRSGLALDPSNWITELICYQNEIRSTASLLLSPNKQERNANEFLFFSLPVETSVAALLPGIVLDFSTAGQSEEDGIYSL